MCPLNVTDAALIASGALPAASATAYTTGIDLGINASAPQGASAGFVGISAADFVGDVEFEFDAPALNSTQLPNGDTMTYSIQTDVQSSFGTATTLMALFVQTGAGGAGAAAASQRFRVPVAVSRYIRGAAVSSSGTAATAASMTLTPKF